MSQVAVDASGHEHVPLLLLALYEMVEVGARVDHGRRPGALAHDQHGRAEDEPCRVHGRGEYVLRTVWEEAMVYETFRKREPVCDVVCLAVAG